MQGILTHYTLSVHYTEHIHVGPVYYWYIGLRAAKLAEKSGIGIIGT